MRFSYRDASYDPRNGPDEATVREFAAAFGDEAFADAVELLAEDGRDRLVDSFPDEFQDGRIDADDALGQYRRGLHGQYGEFEGVGDVTAEDGAATVSLRFADGGVTATVDLAEGGVADLPFPPEYETPDCVDRGAFREREVTVDAGDVALDGVLALPDGDGPFPGVVLVHGHGIHDPDGTAGAAKILRDFGQGLATRGIATLRYEKRLAEHEVADENYALDAVVTDDAVAVLSTLADAAEVSADEVFVAGHSQGGMCAPRIADRFGDAAGVFLLDPPADPVVDPDDLAWLRYSMEPNGDLSEEQEAEFEDMRETFRRIADGDFDPDDTVMGYPGVWHRSHRDCDPVATASGLGAPVFATTTSRVDEELQPELHEYRRRGFEQWRTADLPAGSRTERYERVGHYFQDGPAPWTPVCLYFGGNVADYVVEDAADWIRGVADA